MAGFNQLVVRDGGVGWRGSLQTEDGTAVFECIQTFTPEEARNFGRQLIGAADTADAKTANKEKAESKKKAKKVSKSRAQGKASKRKNR